ncbi:unnamed protein product [Cylicostephanus goldi]|uniref:Peptidase M13 C-terminal domain-containing protein n=1 Tax=Cylicostephanus goldi TaxID=71465 RepID=A0A3P7N5Q7_CYLGO|nr:unnamed protein product [Cylicostephanus goldi]
MFAQTSSFGYLMFSLLVLMAHESRSSHRYARNAKVAGRVEALNYGGIGAVIGHEITHGFDDQGKSYKRGLIVAHRPPPRLTKLLGPLSRRQFDAIGNLREWWDADVKKKFTDRAQCIINQYGKIEVSRSEKVPGTGLKINGKLTQGENIADNGGVKQAYRVTS